MKEHFTFSHEQNVGGEWMLYIYICIYIYIYKELLMLVNMTGN